MVNIVILIVERRATMASRAEREQESHPAAHFARPGASCPLTLTALMSHVRRLWVPRLEDEKRGREKRGRETRSRAPNKCNTCQGLTEV